MHGEIEIHDGFHGVVCLLHAGPRGDRVQELIEIAAKIGVGPQMQRTEALQVGQITAAQLLLGMDLQERVLQVVRQVHVFARVRFHIRHGRQGIKEPPCFAIGPAVAQKPGIDDIAAVAVMDAVIGAQAEQAVGLLLRKAERKGDVEDILPLCGLGAIRKPVSHRAAHRFRIRVSVVVEERCDETGLQIPFRIKGAQDLGKASQAKRTLLQILSGHFRAHVPGTDPLIFLFGNQRQLHARIHIPFLIFLLRVTARKQVPPPV